MNLEPEFVERSTEEQLRLSKLLLEQKTQLIRRLEIENAALRLQLAERGDE